jgi:hypothetical protein
MKVTGVGAAISKGLESFVENGLRVIDPKYDRLVGRAEALRQEGERMARDREAQAEVTRQLTDRGPEAGQ